MSREKLTYVGVALLGGALGALVGILVAPTSGRQTRRSLARSLGRQKDELLWRGSQARESVVELLRAGL